MVITEWKHPNSEAHCLGFWSLYVNGQDYSEHIPLENRINPMGTLGTYCKYVNGHYEHYIDGKDFLDWWCQNSWIDTIPADPLEVYKAFQLNDWRPGACDKCRRKAI